MDKKRLTTFKQQRHADKTRFTILQLIRQMRDESAR